MHEQHVNCMERSLVPTAVCGRVYILCVVDRNGANQHTHWIYPLPGTNQHIHWIEKEQTSAATGFRLSWAHNEKWERKWTGKGCQQEMELSNSSQRLHSLRITFSTSICICNSVSVRASVCACICPCLCLCLYLRIDMVEHLSLLLYKNYIKS